MTDTVSVGSLHWIAPQLPEFWSIVEHAGTIYARTQAGIAWWVEGERQWQSVKTNPHERYCFGLAAGPNSRSPIYAVENFLYISHDGCRNWSRQELPFSPVSHPAIAADPQDALKVYLFGQIPIPSAATAPQRVQNVLHWSADGGQSWNGPLLVGRPDNGYNPAGHNLLVVAGDGGHLHGGVYMATGHGIYRSPGPLFANDTAEPLLELELSAQRAIEAMAVSPVGKNAIAAVLDAKDGYHLHVSPDGGANWAVRDPYPHKFWIDDVLFADDLLFVKLAHWNPTNNGAHEGAVLMSRDLGQTFVDLTTPDLTAPLAMQMASPLPREGLARSSTHLFVMSRGMGVRSIELASLATLPSTPRAPSQAS